ncbi:MAG: multiubiquitin domain-containing protein [Pseudomonadota bacterium]
MSNDKPKDPDHGRPAVTVFVNTRKEEVAEKELSFDQVVRLAFPQGPFTENIVYTVTYDYEHGGGGSMAPGGESVKVKKEMVFSVGQSDKS